MTESLLESDSTTEKVRQNSQSQIDNRVPQISRLSGVIWTRMRARCDRCSSLAEQIELRNRVRDPRGRHVIANVADLRPSVYIARLNFTSGR